VLNADVPEFGALAEVARARRLRVLDYGRQAQALLLLRQEPLPDGQAITFAADGREHTVQSRLVGAFQAHNLLAALGIVRGCGDRLEDVLPHLDGITGARGRMQLVAHHPSGASAFVDYAHTPDALEQALLALRPHAERRLVVVFGCGGDRDPGKRPQMGAVAVRLADRAVVTDDNPRSEVGDRKEAIRSAFAGLGSGDLLLVAGKGHESGQTVGDRVLPFDDAEVLRRCAAEAGGEVAS
jgi:UDP-N-acetylmuramoyl-L-alanyl-D-glutamate--2,6-diaminopimelate ligase